MENYSKRMVDDYGNVYYFNYKNQLHRTNGSAYIGSNDDKEWRINGRLHRLDGPAIEWGHGFKEWYLNHKKYLKSRHNNLVLFSVLEPRIIDLKPVKKPRNK